MENRKPMVIDLNEVFDNHDAMIDAFFKLHPPRIERFELNDDLEKNYLRIQFSLIEGIWIEHDEKCKEDYYYTSDDIYCGFCLIECFENLDNWLKTNKFEDFGFLRNWIMKHWKYYIQSRKKERKRKNIEADISNLKECLEELKKKGKTDFSRFFWWNNLIQKWIFKDTEFSKLFEVENT